MVKDMLKLLAFAKRESSTLLFVIIMAFWRAATKVGHSASAFYRCPEILFLDEATVRLDSKTRHELLTAIHSQIKIMTVKCLSHQNEIKAHGDNIVKLDS